ncbi:hypothetical protein Tco_1000383 [Tanacetum coccineum]
MMWMTKIQCDVGWDIIRVQKLQDVVREVVLLLISDVVFWEGFLVLLFGRECAKRGGSSYMFTTSVCCGGELIGECSCGDSFIGMGAKSMRPIFVGDDDEVFDVDLDSAC